MEHQSAEQSEKTGARPEPEKGTVVVTVDKKQHRVRPGEYLVSKFKELVGVAADRALDEVIDGHFKPLNDTDRIHIRGGETFVSHVRTGGSS
jgi:hypothetical protein